MYPAVIDGRANRKQSVRSFTRDASAVDLDQQARPVGHGFQEKLCPRVSGGNLDSPELEDLLKNTAGARLP